MRRVLVVANQTIGGPELRRELERRVQAGECSFHVVVPNTAAANYHVVPAAGGLVMAGCLFETEDPRVQRRGGAS